VKAPTHNDVLVLTITKGHLRGDDLAEALREDLLREFERSGSAKVVVDCRFVESLTSVAFRPLLSLLRAVRGKGGHLVLCGLRPLVSEVFHATRMISTSKSTTAPFEEAPDVAAAVAGFKAPAT